MINTRMGRLYKRYMYAIGILGQFLYYLQAIKIFVQKAAADVSLTAFFVGLVSVTSWLLYGILIKDKVLIVANTFAVAGALLVVIGILLYRFSSF